MTIRRRAASQWTPSSLLGTAALVGAWCALWGSISVANLVSGLVIAVAVRRSTLSLEGGHSVRPLALVRLVGVVFADLVISTYAVGREALTPNDHTDESIVEVPIPAEARAHLLLMVVAITLTPGTAVVDADPDTGTLYLHLLHADKRAATVEHIAQISRLMAAAFPTSATTSTVESRPEVMP